MLLLIFFLCIVTSALASKNSPEDIKKLLAVSDSLVKKNPPLSKSNALLALELLGNSNNWTLKARALRLAGAAYQRMSKYDSSQYYLKEAIIFSEQHNEWRELGYAYIALARVYQNLEDHKHAEEYGQKGMDIFTKNKDKTGMLRAGIILGTIRTQFGDYKRALKTYFDALELNKDSLHDVTDELYNDIGVHYLYLKQPQNGLVYLRKNYERVKSEGNPALLEPILDNMGDAYVMLKEYDSAEVCLEKALQIALSLKSKNMIKNTYLDLYKLRKGQGRTEQALDMYLKYANLKDSLFNVEKTKTIYDLETHYQSREKEAQIKLLTLEKTKNAAQRNLLLLTVAIILAVVYFLYRLQREKTARANEKQKQIEIELSESKHQLDNFMQTLLKKNAQIQELSEKLIPSLQQNISLESDDPAEKEDLINRTILTNEDWSSFKELFEKAYPGFIKKIKSRWADLTPAEIRFTVLIKLGLDSREMSEMLGVSQGNIRQLRFRFRKKTGIESEEDIERLVSGL